MNKYVTLALLSCLFAIVAAGCVKVDTPPQLEIQVLDAKGNPVSGAVAGLFESEQEWVRLTNPVQPWRRTGADGKVLFADLHEVTYFFYVRFNGTDNSLGEISLAEPLQRNRKHHIIVMIR